MHYWDTLGRSLIAEDTKESADRIADFLTYSGLDATVSSTADNPRYTVTVPAAQEELAEKLMDVFRQYEDEDEKRAAYYREQCLTHSPVFVPSEEKFRNSTNSSTTFLWAGIAVVAIGLFHFFSVAYNQQEGSVDACVVEIVFGFIFIWFAITTHQKVRMLQSQIMEENAFTDQIIRWCTTTYPAEHLDKCIDAAASDSQSLSEEERFFLRRQLIQNYILREYDISDDAYLDYITDTIYKKLYYPNAVAAAG
ncbi:MAG: hypothetical protein LUF00_07505 [Lachnospiraceae bacterium]|nr:hypothetical protein [Lachnospiraceae bacterium]